MRYTTFSFLLAGLSLAPPIAFAQSNGSTRSVIEIGNPDFRPYPIALPAAREISGNGAPGSVTAQEITDTLRFSFEIAATFKVLDPKGYLANPEKEGLAADQCPLPAYA